MKRNLSDACLGQEVETDAAIAAADLLQKLEKGFYMDRGKRRKIQQADVRGEVKPIAEAPAS